MVGLHWQSRPRRLRTAWQICTALSAPLPTDAATLAASDAPIHVELNAAESVQNRCRLSFVVENKADAAIDSLKLDLAVFGRDGAIERRLVVEMGPVRAAKTMVRTFDVETECGQIGSILLNDVTACAPGDPATCLDRLTLSSRPAAIRFYK
jgi:hypothetical protein